MKRIVLCADDFGQSNAISAGILQLVDAGRLSAVSCLSEAEGWREYGPHLAQWQAGIDIGLHFNLTHRCPQQSWRARPLGDILRDALLGRIDADALAGTLHAQLDRFESVLGRAPDFIDGHQHVHMFPGIRTVVLREIGRRYRSRPPYLRNVDPLPPHRPLIKTTLLKLLNWGFADAAERAGLPHTSGLGGIYSLQPDEDFAARMRGWVAALHDGDLLMCHPGAAAVDADDPIAATRPRELAYLASAEFAALLRESDTRLCRFERIA